MKKRIIPVLLLVMGLFSCENTENQVKEIETEKLTGTKINVGDDFVTKAIVDVVQDSIVLVQNSIGDALIDKYILKNGTMVFSQKIINQGGGLKDLMWPAYAASPMFLSFCEFNQNDKMLRLRKSDLNDFHPDQLENTKIPIIGMFPSSLFNGYLWLDDERVMYIGGTFEENSILTVADITNQQSTPTALWIEDDYNGSIFVKKGVYSINATLYQHPTKPIYIYACGYGQYLEMFALNASYQVENRKVILGKKPLYEVGPDGLNHKIKDGHNPQGVKKVFPTEKYLYIMLENVLVDENRKLLTYKGYSALHNDILQVYDWDGNHIKNIELEFPSHLLSWDAKNKKLYGITEGEESDILMQYELE